MQLALKRWCTFSAGQRLVVTASSRTMTPAGIVRLTGSTRYLVHADVFNGGELFLHGHAGRYLGQNMMCVGF